MKRLFVFKFECVVQESLKGSSGNHTPPPPQRLELRLSDDNKENDDS